MALTLPPNLQSLNGRSLRAYLDSLNNITLSISDLNNVVITGVTDNEVLAYDSGTAKWINQTAAEAGLAAASHVHATSDITSGTMADARIAASNVTQHVASINHNLLLNYVANQHIDWTAGTANNFSNTGSVTSTGAVNFVGASSLKVPAAILDTNSNEFLKFTTTASAVNELTVTNAATGTGATLSATGGDANIDLNLQAKGTGVFNLKATSSGPTEVRLYEDTDNGTNYTGLKAASSLSANTSFTLPSADGSAYYNLITNGSGTLSFFTPPSFYVTRSGNQAVTTATATKILFDTEAFDTNSNFASNKFTPTVAGKYLIALNVEFDVLADGKSNHALIYKNGGQYARNVAQTSGTGISGSMCIAIVSLNGSTDYIEGYCYHDKGSDSNATAFCSIAGYFISP